MAQLKTGERLMGDRDSRLIAGKEIFKTIMQTPAEVLPLLGYNPSEVAYLADMFSLLINRANPENAGALHTFRSSQDMTQNRRHITIDSGQEGVVGLTLNRASDRYAANNPSETAVSQVGMNNKDYPLRVGRFLVVDHQIADDPKKLAELLKTEHYTGLTVRSTNQLATILRLSCIASTLDFDPGDPDRRESLKTTLHQPNGERGVQSWRQVGLNSEAAVLGRYARVLE